MTGLTSYLEGIEPRAKNRVLIKKGWEVKKVVKTEKPPIFRLELTVEELSILANAIASARFGHIEIGMVRDRRLRKIARNFYEKEHEVWMKIIDQIEKQMEV